MGNNLLSIIVPMYNAEQYISACLDSILKSSYSEIEVIVINDESTDGCRDIVAKMSYVDNRIKLFDQNRGGVSAARNVGIQQAKGEFITFVDADDYVENLTYETILNEMIRFKTDAAIYSMIRENIEESQQEIFPWKDKTVLNQDVIKKELIPWTLFAKKGEKWVSGSIWRLVMHRNLLEKLRFNESIKYREDLLFCLQLYFTINSIIVVNDAKYHYVKHATTVTEHYRKEFYKESMECESAIISTIKTFDMWEELKERYSLQRLSVYSLCISNLFRFDAPKNYRADLDEVLCGFKNDEYMENILLSDLDKKYLLVYFLLKTNLKYIIANVYRKKENTRQSNLLH